MVNEIKIRLKMKNRSHKYDINRPQPRHGHKYSKCLITMMALSSTHEKLK